MAKPTKQDKDKLKTETDKLVEKLSGEGKNVQGCVLVADDSMLSLTVEIPGHPGKFVCVETPVFGIPHPNTGAIETAEQYAKRGGLEKRIREMIANYTRMLDGR